MRCYECGGPYIEQHGSLALQNETVGHYSVHNVVYFKCDGCGELLYPKATAKKIEAAEQRKLVSLISKLPVGEFVSSIEAADFLGISRQAFHKHRKIKNGFVYSIVVSGKKFFNKKSLFLFKETGDGRYILSDGKKQEEQEYRELSMFNLENVYRSPAKTFADVISSWTKLKTAGLPNAFDCKRPSLVENVAKTEFEYFKFRRPATSSIMNKMTYGAASE